ncbi:MAG: hypothetical protein COB33_010460 [Thiotrichaceae bacterium]|nr:hypothetical protein [Thiotrichaceae bacterium]PCI14509.1 MAG: hypothetical protein COB71_02080 [Thiotrichales bacterium]
MPDKKPITNKSSERKISIIENTPAVFEISDDLNVVDTAPIYEIDSKSEVVRWCGLIIHVSERHNVDPRLAMAIMYMETTHGWYEKLYPNMLEKIYSIRKSVLPMNIHYHYWRKMGVTKENLNCPYYNIEFGVILLERIQNRIESPTIKKIASIYNFLGAEKITNYGARVAKLYLSQPWVKKGCA